MASGHRQARAGRGPAGLVGADCADLVSAFKGTVPLRLGEPGLVHSRQPSVSPSSHLPEGAGSLPVGAGAGPTEGSGGCGRLGGHKSQQGVGNPRGGHTPDARFWVCPGNYLWILWGTPCPCKGKDVPVGKACAFHCPPIPPGTGSSSAKHSQAAPKLPVRRGLPITMETGARAVDRPPPSGSPKQSPYVSRSGEPSAGPPGCSLKLPVPWCPHHIPPATPPSRALLGRPQRACARAGGGAGAQASRPPALRSAAVSFRGSPTGPRRRESCSCGAAPRTGGPENGNSKVT